MCFIASKKFYKKREYNKFLDQLYDIVNDESTDHLIKWNPDGEEHGFIIFDPKQLETEIISKHFKQKDLKSFVRQLNLYEFHLKNKRQKCVSRVFYNDNFRRNDRKLLAKIVRMIPS